MVMCNTSEKPEQENISTEEYLLKKQIIGNHEPKKSHLLGDYLSEASLLSSFFFNNL